MTVLVVKFPEDNKKKVSMSRFLSNYTKREFSVIVDVEKEKLSYIFENLNHNDCKVLIAKDRSVKVDYSTYFLLYLFSKKLEKEKSKIYKEIIKNDIEIEENKKKEIDFREPELFELLEVDVQFKKMLNKFQKDSDLYFQKFKDEYITKNKMLYSDWPYRIRVEFDTISILAIEIYEKLEELNKAKQLDSHFKLLFAIHSGNNNLGDIIKFTNLQDVNDVNKLEELINSEIVYKDPYRLTDIGQLIIKTVRDNLKKSLSFKIPSEKDIFLSEIMNNDYARQLTNLLIYLCLLTIKNRKVKGLTPINNFQRISFGPDE